MITHNYLVLLLKHDRCISSRLFDDYTEATDYAESNKRFGYDTKLLNYDISQADILEFGL